MKINWSTAAYKIWNTCLYIGKIFWDKFGSCSRLLYPGHIYKSGSWGSVVLPNSSKTVNKTIWNHSFFYLGKFGINQSLWPFKCLHALMTEINSLRTTVLDILGYHKSSVVKAYFWLIYEKKKEAKFQFLTGVLRFVEIYFLCLKNLFKN